MASDAWEHFATSAAERYICTEIDSSTPEGRDAFFRSGQEYVEGLVTELGGLVPRRRVALDFGCGVGRLTIPLASRFERVTAVDVSPTMLQKLRANCAERQIANITPFLTDEEWEATGPFDLVNSFLVFQHLAEDSELAVYLARLASCLGENGILRAAVRLSTPQPGLPGP